MLLWIGFAVLTAAVVAALLRPLLSSGDVESSPDVTAAAAGAVYRDQLAEIEQERARGLIAEQEADAARVEIARRLLSSAEVPRQEEVSTSPPPLLRMIAMTTAAALPVVAIVTYLILGAPDRPGVPYASRATTPVGSQNVSEMITQVEARLRQHPEDGRGWDVIAPVYFRMGRYSEAADAFTRAMRLLGENPDRLAGVAESQVFANDGIVNETARVAYVRLQQIMPDRIEPRFWLAVAAEQDGRFEEAATAFEKMLIEGEASAPWRSTVVERWRAVRTRLGLATDPVPQRAPDVASAGKVPAIAKDDADAIRAMPADGQKEMIEQMVAGLDQRLSEDGRDLAGWQRLIRAYTVLGRRDDALAALARARAALAQETQSLEALGELAKSLGLAS